MLDDLRVHPGNRLEKLKGDGAGQYGIRVNSQTRYDLEIELDRPGSRLDDEVRPLQQAG